MQSSKSENKSIKQSEQLQQYNLEVANKTNQWPKLRRKSFSEPDLTEVKRPDTPRPPKASHDL